METDTLHLSVALALDFGRRGGDTDQVGTGFGDRAAGCKLEVVAVESSRRTGMGRIRERT